MMPDTSQRVEQTEEKPLLVALTFVGGIWVVGLGGSMLEQFGYISRWEMGALFVVGAVAIAYTSQKADERWGK